MVSKGRRTFRELACWMDDAQHGGAIAMCCVTDLVVGVLHSTVHLSESFSRDMILTRQFSVHSIMSHDIIHTYHLRTLHKLCTRIAYVYQVYLWYGKNAYIVCCALLLYGTVLQ